MPYRFVSEAEHKERSVRAAELAGQGWSYRKIAAELGCDATQIGPYLDAAGGQRNPRNGDVPPGKVSLNGIREQTGQHLNTIKKVLAAHGVAIETVSLFDGRSVLLVDETALPTLLCSQEGCSRLATVESTGTCKRHSKIQVSCAHCGKRLSRRPADANRRLNFFCSWSHRSKYLWENALALPLVETMSGKTRRVWKLRWTKSPGRTRNEGRKYAVEGELVSYATLLERIAARYGEKHETERDLERCFAVSRRIVRHALGRPL